ncbi:MAG TPA: hypothetical protein VM121_08330 [Acidimicrobiales bacterium]|nr:hypothetical protein [Acidimicrobiales bacterium]
MFAAGAMAGVASGQILTNQGAGVSNSGGASANTGSNSATGNGSSNAAAIDNTGGGGTGGLLGALLTLGGPTNTSTGSSNVNTGPASAQGNLSNTGVGQAQGAGGGLSNSQGVSVSNGGRADANTGGNTAVGNGSTNTASIIQNASGGLLGVNVNLGSPTNSSSGTANIVTGPADAIGNVSDSAVSQEIGGGGGAIVGGTLAGTTVVDGRLVHCGGLFNSQGAHVDNSGVASANTGDNVAIGNNSTNVATTSNDLGTGLLDAPISLGGPTNTSTGSADVLTGPASALGNQSTTAISQQQCVPPGARLNPAFATPTVFQVARTTPTGQLAFTGQNPFQLIALGGAVLIAGYVLVRSTRRRQRVFLP